MSQPALAASSGTPVWQAGALSVNETSGNLMLSLPGPSFPSPAGSLGMSLSYNSLDGGDRGLGAGWLLDPGAGGLSAPVELVDENLLTGANRLDAVVAVASDGTPTCFAQVGETNTFIDQPGSGQELSKNADGTWTLLSGNTVASYGVADGATAVASLETVESTSGGTGKAKLSFTFSDSDPSKILSVGDGTDRTVSFAWNSLDPGDCAAAIVCVKGPDHQVWQFIGTTGSGTSGRLARVNDGTRDIAAVSYDGSGRVDELQNANDLDPTHASAGYDASHAVAISYDGSGRVASVSSGPITNQSPSTSTWSFAYHPGAVLTTAIRAAHGSLAAGTVRTAAGYTLVTPPDQQGLGSPAQEKVFYDGHGNLLEDDDLTGAVTEAGYTSSDELAWTEDANGNPTDNSWDPVNDVLLSTAAPDPDGGGSLARPLTSFRYDETSVGSASTAGPPLEGLAGAYFDNQNLAGRPTLLETDPTVDFDWGSGGPTGLGASDHFSVRWTGDLSIAAAGAYTFSTVSDEGTRLVIDDTVAIDNWTDQTVTTVSSQPITLSAGLHKITLEYYEDTGPAEVHLQWACAACSPAINTEVIPSTALRPAWLNQTTTVSPTGKLTFDHYKNPTAGLPDYQLQLTGSGTDPITSYSYDDYGRLTEQVMPKGNANRTIDVNGNLTGTPDNDYATTWTYYAPTESAYDHTCSEGDGGNQGGQLESESIPGSADKTYIYDRAGRPIVITDGAGETCLYYDGEERLTARSTPLDSLPWTCSPTIPPATCSRPATGPTSMRATATTKRTA